MKDQLDTLLERMQLREKELLRELQKKKLEFFYEVRQRKVRFTNEARERHRQLVKPFTSYLRDSHFLILLTTPVIWACLIPIALVDLAMSIYPAVCFPIYQPVEKHRAADFHRCLTTDDADNTDWVL